MKRMMTRQQLYQIDQEYKDYKKNNPGLHLALTVNIKRFYVKASHELEVTAGRFNAIKDLYVQRDAEGNFLTEINGDTTEWKLIVSGEELARAGVIDISMVKKDFDECCNKLFSQTISFDW